LGKPRLGGGGNSESKRKPAVRPACAFLNMASDPTNFTFLTMTTKPSFRATFKPAEEGKTAIYMARWVNTRGEKGPWSEVATATVAA
jgi:hypothetical protein